MRVTTRDFWWRSNSRLTGIHQSQVRRVTHCATPPIIDKLLTWNLVNRGTVLIPIATFRCCWCEHIAEGFYSFRGRIRSNIFSITHKFVKDSNQIFSQFYTFQIFSLRSRTMSVSFRMCMVVAPSVTGTLVSKSRWYLLLNCSDKSRKIPFVLTNCITKAFLEPLN